MSNEKTTIPSMLNSVLYQLPPESHTSHTSHTTQGLDSKYDVTDEILSFLKKKISKIEVTPPPSPPTSSPICAHCKYRLTCQDQAKPTFSKVTVVCPCGIRYCSESCQIKDWTNHLEVHSERINGLKRARDVNEEEREYT